MATVAERIAGVAKSLDGRGLSLYSLTEAVAPEASSGAVAWREALNRNERLAENYRRVVPRTSMGKVENNRKTTHVVLLEDAPDVVRFILKQPSDFFGDQAAVEALGELVGHDPVRRTAQEVQRAAAEQEAQQLRLLPVLTGQLAPAKLRTLEKSGLILGSVYDFCEMLGVNDHVWRNWLCSDFTRHVTESHGGLLSMAPCSAIPTAHDQIQIPVLEYIVLPGARTSTPMTNYAGFCIILRLCAGKSAITDAMLDEATDALGRFKVGDQRLHEEIQRNAASSSTEERAFVLGPEEALAQQAQSSTPTEPPPDVNASLHEVGRSTEVKTLMYDFWAKAIAFQLDTVAETAKASIAAAGQSTKTTACQENAKRQLILASRKAEIAVHRANELEACCRIEAAKRRLDELAPQGRRPARRARVAAPVVGEETTAVASSNRHLDRPLCGAALAALKSLAPDPNYNAYRACGIPDGAVPRDVAQAKAWYDLACKQQLLMRPSEGPEARLALVERGSRDVYGEPVRPEFCLPPYRAPPSPSSPPQVLIEE